MQEAGPGHLIFGSQLTSPQAQLEVEASDSLLLRDERVVSENFVQR